MFPFPALIDNLKAAPKTIVFTEGTDARILEATDNLLKLGGCLQGRFQHRGCQNRRPRNL